MYKEDFQYFIDKKVKAYKTAITKDGKSLREKYIDILKENQQDIEYFTQRYKTDKAFEQKQKEYLKEIEKKVNESMKEVLNSFTFNGFKSIK